MNNTEEIEYIEIKGWSTWMVTIVVVATILITLFGTLFYCKINEDIEIGGLKRTNEYYAEKVETLEKEVEELEDRLNRLMKSNEKVTTEAGDVSSENLLLRKEIDELKRENRELEAELEVMRDRADKYQAGDIWEY